VLQGFGSANPQDQRTFDIMRDGRIVGVVTAGEELKRLVPRN
jgi:hypothetical protein